MKFLLLFFLIMTGTTCLFSGGEPSNNPGILGTCSLSSLAGKLRIQLSTVTRYIQPGNYPQITVHLSYRGSGSKKINWDNDFARVLWRGDLTLVATANGKRLTSAGLKNRTSAVYETRIVRSLQRGTTLVSVIDFNQHPAIYLRRFFKLGSRIHLCLHTNDGNRPVGNPLTIIVR